MKWILLLILLIGLVGASEQICVDFDSPSQVNSLTATENFGTITLFWENATDEPSCSGIEKYEIEYDGTIIGQTTSNSFTDTNAKSAGTYIYKIYAIDKVGHKSVSQINYTITQTHQITSSGRGHRTDDECEEDWECEDWSECVDGNQIRICTDKNDCGIVTSKPETSTSCESEESLGEILNINQETKPPLTLSSITGAVIGAAKTPQGVATSALLVVALTSFLLIRIKKKRK